MRAVNLFLMNINTRNQDTLAIKKNRHNRQGSCELSDYQAQNSESHLNEDSRQNYNQYRMMDSVQSFGPVISRDDSPKLPTNEST